MAKAMIDSAKLLAGLPSGLREPLLNTYKEIASNYVERRWEPSELNGGKFCEAVYSIINGAVTGSFPDRPSGPDNMAQACRALEGKPANATLIGDKSLRVYIPRMLIPLYDIRNNRGVGHIGGDVDPNYMDATAVFSAASWILAELVRIFHSTNTAEAQSSVDALVERKLPLVWSVAGVRRVLDSSMPTSDQVLVLLYGEPAAVADKELSNWVEYSSPSMFRTRVLEPLHKARFIEFDRKAGNVHISPLGTREVENRIHKAHRVMG
jgi:hypothetical protein